ncbi:hypothetical protein ACU6RU_04245 [Microbacterium sp. F1-18]
MRAASRFRAHRSAYTVVAATALANGVTSVGIPLLLASAGLDSVQIAAFFIFNAAVAVLLNTVALRAITRRQYPPQALRLTTALSALGIAIIAFNPTEPALLYTGGALMLLTTMTLPQIMGRTSRQAPPADRDAIVIDLRQILVAGYISGLLFLSLASLGGPLALLAGAAFTAVGAVASWSPRLAQTLEPEPTRPVASHRGARSVAIAALIVAIGLVGTMKAVDALRGIYLPVYIVESGLPASLAAALFAATAIVELAVLPLLAIVTARIGPARCLAFVAASGTVAFLVPLLTPGVPGLVASQVIYAVFAAGFQGVGLVLLSRVASRDAGLGAGLYVAVIQIGTVIGAVSPLAASTTQQGIFVAAIAMCGVCVALAIALAAMRKPTEDERG